MSKNPSFKTLIFEKHFGIALITLNRPQVLNAYNVQMRDDLWEVLNAIKDDEEIRAVVIQGAGRAFCAGADLNEFLTAPSPTVARTVRLQRDIYRLLFNLPQPTLAALHGYVIGSGLELALSCDIRIAAQNTIFALPETALGFIPGAGATQLLPRTVGRATAIKMVLTGKRLDADQAFRVGLVSCVVPIDHLLESAQKMAGQLASIPAPICLSIKKAIHRGADLPLQHGLHLERLLNIQLRQQYKRMRR